MSTKRLKSLPDAAPFGQRRIDEMIAASNDVELLLRNAVARFIAEALLPIRLVEDPSFTELLDLCFAIGAKGRRNSQEMLGKRKGFTQHCDVLYESLLTKSFAEKIMAGPDKFTLTFDSRTTVNKGVSITAMQLETNNGKFFPLYAQPASSS